MTSREKRFRKKQAEEVQKALKGYARCPQCKKLVEEIEPPVFSFTTEPMCSKCATDATNTFINEMTEDFKVRLNNIPAGTTRKI